jgi:hypothetical protein
LCGSAECRLCTISLPFFPPDEGVVGDLADDIPSPRPKLTLCGLFGVWPEDLEVSSTDLPDKCPNGEGGGSGSLIVRCGEGGTCFCLWDGDLISLHLGGGISTDSVVGRESDEVVVGVGVVVEVVIEVVGSDADFFVAIPPDLQLYAE